MKILICNKYYYRRGGDCIYTINLVNLLRSRGHEVAVFAMDHPETLENGWRSYFPAEVNFNEPGARVKYFRRCMGDSETRRQFCRLLDDFRPDVVHLNNIHSQLSPLIAVEAHKRGIRVVWTLHDYKLLCPRYDCLVHGKTVCELCFDDKSQVLKKSCMKDSFTASAVAYIEALRWNRRILADNTDVFICPSRFMAMKMVQGGFPSNKLVPLCNFIDESQCERERYSDRGDYYCYVGRLSHEKGVRTLAKTASGLPYRLVVVGDGPVAGELPKASNIDYVGRKDWDDIKEIVGRARFLVIPSEWYENNPLSVIEALCLGTPVLGADIGGIPELIEAGVSGSTFISGDSDSLSRGIQYMYDTVFDYEAIAMASRDRFSSEKYYQEYIGLCHPNLNT